MLLEQPQAEYNGKPQTEDGYVRIANELMEAIYSFDFSKHQIKVILVVIRKTYGYNKKSDSLSGWQIAKMANLDRSDISRTISELVQMRVLVKHEEGRSSHGQFINELSINKHYREWLTVGETPPLVKHHRWENTNQTVGETPIRPLVKHHTQKTTTKDNNKRQVIPTPSICPDGVDQSVWIDFTTLRKTKKSPITKTALSGIEREAKKAGFSLNDALAVCCERGWQGFNAKWVDGVSPKASNETPEQFAKRMTS